MTTDHASSVVEARLAAAMDTWLRKVTPAASAETILNWVCDQVRDGIQPTRIYQAASTAKHEALKAQVQHQDALFRSYSTEWAGDEQRAEYAMLVMAACYSQYPEHRATYKQLREEYIAKRSERRLAWHAAGRELKPPEGEI